IGLMPIFAAWSIGRAGRFTVENAMGVLVSFALLKVAAAFVYMSAVWAALNLDGSEENKLISLVIFGAAGLCAPALLSIILPQMKGQAGGWVGAAAAGGAGALAAGGAAMSAAGSAGSGSGSAMGLTEGGSGGGGSSSGGRGPSGGSGPSGGGGPSTGGRGSSGGGGTSGGGGGGGSGSGPSTGGGHARSGAAAGQTAARIARNSAGMAGSALRAGGGILDDSVG